MYKKINAIIITVVLTLTTLAPIHAHATDKSFQNLNRTVITTITQALRSIFPFKQRNLDIDATIENMSLDERIGQLFMIPYPDDDSDLESYNKTYAPAGYIFYERDVKGKTKDEIKDTIKTLNTSATIPLFISTDEEGGTVVRLSSNPNIRDEPFESPRQIYERDGLQGLIDTESAKCHMMNELGFNLNLAPVCDIATTPHDFMYNRSLGLDPETAATAISNIVTTMNENEMMGCLKHFPGYGDNKNTHIDTKSKDHRKLNEFRENEFIVFQAGIYADAPCVMFSHNITNHIDNEYPASLSIKCHNILRYELNFDGLTITDDINMAACKAVNNTTPRAILAFLAGNDLMITSNPAKDYHAIEWALENDMITEQQINDRIKRTLDYKSRYDIYK